MKVVKVGGPVYRIGVGGGAASSIQVKSGGSSALVSRSDCLFSKLYGDSSQDSFWLPLQEAKVTLLSSRDVLCLLPGWQLPIIWWGFFPPTMKPFTSSNPSCVQVQGDNTSELDFGAVQRGDAEMEQKMHRVLRGCVESGEDNPICSLHDQGAGGNGEGGGGVLKLWGRTWDVVVWPHFAWWCSSPFWLPHLLDFFPSLGASCEWDAGDV